MTTVAAVQGDGWVVMGYDSIVVGGDRQYLLPQDHGKVVENAGYLMGVAGDLRVINLLEYDFHPPDPGGKTGADLDRFLVAKFIPAVKKCLVAGGVGDERKFKSDLLVAVNGVAYEIGNVYEYIREDRGLYGIGTGSAYALGALTALLNGKERTISSAKKAMNAAIGIAASLDPGSSRPVNVRVQEFWS